MLLYKFCRNIFLIGLIVFLLYGCGNINEEMAETDDYRETEEIIETNDDYMECEIIAEAYSDIYNDELQKNSIENIEIIRSIINRLGEKGYTAVDSLNQIDMVCSEQAKQFCEKVAAKETGEITII